jgi:single-strand DNA-binding protein
VDYLNRVELCGRLTRDPEMRKTTRGTSLANIGLATNRWSTDADGERKEWTDYHNVVAWSGLAGQLAELCRGDWLHIRGRLTSRSWEGQDGQKRRTTEVVVEEIVSTTARAATPALDEEVPFQ